jgi:prevent-host-death family protein
MAKRISDQSEPGPESLGVAEAKRRFAELIDRVQRGERFLVSRRGRPAVALVPPVGELRQPARPAPVGLAAVAGALADWEELDQVVADIYAARRRARDRPSPELG